MVRFCVRAVPSVYSAFPREQLGDVSGGRSEIYETWNGAAQFFRSMTNWCSNT